MTAGFRTLTSILLTSACICCPLRLGAQQTHVDEISVDTRATFHQQTIDGVYDTHFQGDYFNFHFKGHLTDNITFRIRQRMNKKIDEHNPFNATDFLWIKWQATPKWSVTLGKQGILVGGYEFDSPPIEVYYYSAFLSHLYQYYAFGVSATYTYAPDQTVSIQFAPSPVSSGLQDAYSYNLYWSGRPSKYWKTLWSANIVEDQYHRKMSYIALGNKFPLGALVLDLDLMTARPSSRRTSFPTGPSSRKPYGPSENGTSAPRSAMSRTMPPTSMSTEFHTIPPFRPETNTCTEAAESSISLSGTTTCAFMPSISVTTTTMSTTMISA